MLGGGRCPNTRLDWFQATGVSSRPIRPSYSDRIIEIPVPGPEADRRRTSFESQQSNQMPEISKPIPSVTPDLREFFDGAREGRLMVQKCDSCGTLRFPAHELCAKCNSTRSKWVRVSGRG